MRARLVTFEVHHFRLFERERLDIHPSVTVLVGSNDTGKSTLLEAVRLYGLIGQRAGFRGPLFDERLSETGDKATRFVAAWRDGEDHLWSHTLTLDPKEPEERLTCEDRFWVWSPKARTLQTDRGTFDAKEIERYASLAQIDAKRWQIDTDVPADVYEPLSIARSFHTAEAYLFEPSALAKPAPIRQTTPDKNGFAWSNWLQGIINRRNDDITDLERDIRALFPFFGSVRIMDEGTTRHVLIDVAAGEGEGVRVSAPHISSGLLLALSHFALLHASSKGDIILLEEPENGLNGEITLQMIRAFLSVVAKREQQLILTTHHPFWLDLVEPSSIRLLTRDAGGAHIRMVTSEIEAARRDDVYASEVMGMYGPKGLLYVKDREGR